MKKIVLFLLLLNSVLFSNSFSEKQDILNDIKEQIAFEESIANAFEIYLLEYFKIPETTNADFKSLLTNSSKNLDLDKSTLSLEYGISDLTSEYKTIYENNMYRDRTFIINNRVYFSIKNEFAKHILTLLSLTNQISIEACPKSSNAYSFPEITCIENNTIYIGAKERLSDVFTNESRPSKFLLAYTFENFANGPIVMQDAAINRSNKILSIFRNGTLFYDEKGDKHVKVEDDAIYIKELQW